MQFSLVYRNVEKGVNEQITEDPFTKEPSKSLRRESVIRFWGRTKINTDDLSPTQITQTRIRKRRKVYLDKEAEITNQSLLKSPKVKLKRGKTVSRQLLVQTQHLIQLQLNTFNFLINNSMAKNAKITTLITL